MKLIRKKIVEKKIKEKKLKENKPVKMKLKEKKLKENKPVEKKLRSNKSIRTKSIRTKLIASTLSIAIAVTVILSIMSIVNISTVITRSFDSFLTPLASQSSQTVSTYVQNYVDRATSVTTNPLLTGAESQEKSINYLKTVSSTLKCENYFYYNADGTLISTNSNSDESYNTDPAFQKAIDTKTRAFSSPFNDATGNSRFLTFYPILNGSKEVKSLLVTLYDYEPINNLVNSVSFSDNGEAYLINADGIKTTDKDITKIDLSVNPIELAKSDDNYKDIAAVHKKALLEEKGYINFKNNGIKSVAGHCNVPGFDSYLIITAPITDLIHWNTFLVLIIGLSILLLIITIIVIATISKRIAKPIIDTSERLKALAEGNLTDPVKIVNTKDELYVLSTSLDETVKSLNMYVSKITQGLTDIADGNLTDRVHGVFQGDFHVIKRTFNTILSSLIDTFSSINVASEQVNSGANQVSNGAQALSQGATQQASAIEELSSTIFEVSEQIKGNAKSAKKSEKIAENNAQQIVLCNKEMGSMVNAMTEINLSSNEISKIIKVIDDIAFQTNILALNAAVEAARAGSAGKGFAVVADEVRSLAAKSAEAAKQTTVLIEGSVKSVSNGTKIAKQTADALNEIVESTNQVTKLVKQISQASEEQADAIVQINTGLDQISGVVQTNTATAEESAAASEELSSQSLILKDMIAKFRLGNKEEIFGDDPKFYVSSAQTSSTINDGNITLDSKPIDDFKFIGAIENAKQDEFTFKAAKDEAPAEEFKFKAAIEDSPVEEFKFAGDLTISLDDDDDSKY